MAITSIGSGIGSILTKGAEAAAKKVGVSKAEGSTTSGLLHNPFGKTGAPAGRSSLTSLLGKASGSGGLESGLIKDGIAVFKHATPAGFLMKKAAETKVGSDLMKGAQAFATKAGGLIDSPFGQMATKALGALGPEGKAAAVVLQGSAKAAPELLGSFVNDTTSPS